MPPMTASTTSPFAGLIDALRTAPTAPGERNRLKHRIMHETSIISSLSDAKGAADALAREVLKEGLQMLQ